MALAMIPRRPELALLPLFLGIAAPAPASEDTQLWTSSAASIDLGGKWLFSGETTARFSDDRGGLYEIETNLLLGYRLPRGITLAAGYTHDPLYTAGRFRVMERRAREQISIDDLLRIGPGSLSARLRLEQRWREGASGTGWRLRPFLRYSLPLARGGRTALVLSHESFVNLNRSGGQTRTGVERMRNLVAVRRAIVPGINAEIGYLNQHGFVTDGPDARDHVASLSLGLSF